MSQPTNCQVVYSCLLDCFLIVWDADPGNVSYYELQRREPAGAWQIVEEGLAPAESYDDCEVGTPGAFQYRIRSHYPLCFVDDDEDIWIDDDEGCWGVDFSEWCTTGVAYSPTLWWTPVTWDAVVSGPRF